MIERRSAPASSAGSSAKRARTNGAAATASSSSAAVPVAQQLADAETAATSLQQRLACYDVALHHAEHLVQYQSFLKRQPLYAQRDALYRRMLDASASSGSETNASTSLWATVIECLVGEMLDETDGDILEHLVALRAIDHEPRETVSADNQKITYSSTFSLEFEFDTPAVEQWLTQPTITKQVTYSQTIKNPDVESLFTSTTADDTDEATAIDMTITPSNVWKDSNHATENHDAFFVSFFKPFSSETESNDDSAADQPGVPQKVQLEICEALRRDIYPNPTSYLAEMESAGEDRYVFDDAEDPGSDDDLAQVDDDSDDEAPGLVE